MEFTVMDEAVIFAGHGLTLIVNEGESDALCDGCRIRDVRGTVHTVQRVSRQEGMICLYLPDAETAYMERLLRDVRVDATRFTLLEGEA